MNGHEPNGLALWEARLEVELCHRALALLRLQLSSAQEDVDDLQVRRPTNVPCTESSTTVVCTFTTQHTVMHQTATS
jgi:hypothetical protein